MFLLLACAPEHLDQVDTAWEAHGALELAREEPAEVPDRVGWCDFRPDVAFENAATVANIGRIHAPGGTEFAWPAVDADGDGKNLHFEATDELVMGMQAMGLQQWVTLSTHKVPDHELAPMWLPADTAGWSLFVEAMVERYDGDGVDDMPGLLWPVVAYEIGNEPEEVIAPMEYRDVVRVTAEAIRAADEDVLILNGGTKPVHFTVFDGPDTDNPHADWWEQFFQGGGGALIDRFQVHESVGLDAPAAWTLALWEPMLSVYEPRLLEGIWIGESGPMDHDGQTNVSDLSGWTLEHYEALPVEVEFAAVCGSERLSGRSDVLDAVAQLND